MAISNSSRPIGVRFAISPNEEMAKVWVMASCSFVQNRLRVEVLRGSEVEVNGVVTTLNQAVTQALRADEPEPFLLPEATAPAWYSRAWSVTEQ